MIMMVLLAIVSHDGLTIAIVGAPFALMRGGASPHPFSVYIIAHFGVILEDA